MEEEVSKTLISNSNLHNGRSDEQEDKDAKPKHHGGSFGNYMAYKNQKLHEQFIANASITRQSDLFQGVAIYVNGWTSPSHSELKQIMATHGGRFENYYSRSTVTHIICTNLPDAKVKQFEKERSPTPVVRPDWIVQSIEAGKLLPIQEYILWQLRGGPGQRTLQDVFAPGGGFGAEEGTMAPQPPLPPPAKTKEPTPPATAVTAAGPSTLNQKTNNKANNNSYDPGELAAAQDVAAQMRADCDNLKGPPRSSKDDPNFVESFYRASRLHFIGSWKARLETLMASSAAIEAPSPAPYTLGGGKRIILHLDLDCFFASVTEAGHHEFKGKPLAVCHSNSTRGSGEVSSANYEARKYGIGASMFISRAKELCPEIIVVPYEFDKYEKVSEQVYRILLKYTSAVQPVSCDEAFLDITGLGDPETIAASIRSDIFKATQCTASAGIGPNILLARIATRKAKPNGIFNLIALTSSGAGTSITSSTATVLPFLAELSVEDLPGVGWSTKRKLEELGIHTVADIHASSKTTMQTELGANAGALLWDFAHGRDSRRVEGPKPRRSVGAEVNWGVRFETPEDPEKFVASLATEVATRMHQSGVRGRTITLKLKRKKPGWTEPVKFLGCGACDSFSKSVTLASMTSAAEDLEREGKVLLRMLRVPFDEIRGMGLTVTRLDTSSTGTGTSTIPGGTGGTGVGVSAVTGATAAAAAAADPASASAGLGGFIEGSEPSDAGWEIDSESDGIPHKKHQQQLLDDISPSSKRAASLRKTTEQTRASPSPSLSPSGRGVKRKSPSGGKQTSLLDMMPPPPPRTSKRLHADINHEEEEGDEDDAEEGERLLAPSARRELLAKYDGLSLTQIDADELAALPYQLQRELVSRLPRTRLNNMNNNAGGGGHSAVVQKLPTPAAAAPVAAAAQEASGSKRPERAQAYIEPLPAFSQLDQSVLDALPLQMRRELETAYGMKRTIKATDTTSASASGSHHHHRRQNQSPPKYAGSSKIVQHNSKLRRIDAFVKPKDGPAPPPLFSFPSSRGNLLSGKHRNSTNSITLSQIDPGVLHELPRELQDEVLRQLQPFPSAKSKAATAGARKAVEAKSAAAEIFRQRQHLEDLHAAQVEGASLDDGEDDLENILQELEGVELPSAVEALVLMANKTENTENADVATLAEVLEALTAAVDETNDIMLNIESQPSQTNDSSQSPPSPRDQENVSIYPKAVMAAISRLGRKFINNDLEGTRKLLMRVKRVGEEYPCFSSASDAVIEKLQRRVQRRYGWRVSLASIL